jgi:hypothetical protein
MEWGVRMQGAWVCCDASEGRRETASCCGGARGGGVGGAGGQEGAGEEEPDGCRGCSTRLRVRELGSKEGCGLIQGAAAHLAALGFDLVERLIAQAVALALRGWRHEARVGKRGRRRTCVATPHVDGRNSAACPMGHVRCVASCGGRPTHIGDVGKGLEAAGDVEDAARLEESAGARGSGGWFGMPVEDMSQPMPVAWWFAQHRRAGRDTA